MVVVVVILWCTLTIIIIITLLFTMKINSATKKFWCFIQCDIFFPSWFVSDLAAIRKILENETGGSLCPSCQMPFDKGKKRKLIDTCGHERCYSCMFRNEACPICRCSNNSGVSGKTTTTTMQDNGKWHFIVVACLVVIKRYHRQNFVGCIRGQKCWNIARLSSYKESKWNELWRQKTLHSQLVKHYSHSLYNPISCLWLANNF